MGERNQDSTFLYASVIGLTLATGAYLLSKPKKQHEEPDQEYEALLSKL